MEENKNFSNKEINRVIRPIAILIISFVLLLMLPVLSGLVAIPFFLLGQHVAYVVSRLIQNLYGPILMIIVITIFPVVYRIFRALGKQNTELSKPSIENRILLLVLLVVGIYFTFQFFKNIGNVILDIGIIATSNYDETEGELEFYEILVGDEHSTRMEVNDIKFDGGNVQAGELIEGNTYYVKYLPHTKYVVDYKKME